MNSKDSPDFEKFSSLPGETEEFIKSETFDKLTDAGAVTFDLMTGTPTGTVIKSLKDITQSYHNYRFSNKLIGYLNNIDSLRISERVKLMEMLHKDTGKKAGEVILNHIDDMDEEKKIPLYARLSIAYVRKKISNENFLRCSHILSNTYYSDLESLPDYVSDHYKAGESEELFNNGLLRVTKEDRGSIVGGISMKKMATEVPESLEYQATALGEIFIQLFEDTL